MYDLNDILALPDGVSLEVERDIARHCTMLYLRGQGASQRIVVTDALLHDTDIGAHLQAVIARQWGAEWPGWAACSWCGRGRYLDWGDGPRCERCGEHRHRATGAVQDVGAERARVGARTLTTTHLLGAEEIADL